MDAVAESERNLVSAHQIQPGALSYGLGIGTSTFLEFNKSSQVPIMRKWYGDGYMELCFFGDMGRACKAGAHRLPTTAARRPSGLVGKLHIC